VADLVVDLALLQRTAGDLDVLIEEFGNASGIVSSSSGAVADPDLVTALEEFAGNWRVHREKLLGSMHAVHQMTTASHQAYVTTDNKLAGELRGGNGR
jgi:hypothetical protein